MKSIASISVITVTFNAVDLIERTIKSVISQTYKKIEYIIIDGGSTDNTIGIIKKYTDKISQFITEKDNGIFDAMNKGLALAKGDYVLFLNAGDVSSSETILSRILLNHDDIDVFYGKVALIDKNGETCKIPRTPKHLSCKKMTKGWGAIPICHQAFIPKRKLCPEYNLKYKFTSDFDWMIRILRKAKNISNTNIVISNYLLGGYSSKYLKNVWEDRLLIIKDNYGLMALYYTYGKRYAVKLKKALEKTFKSVQSHFINTYVY